MKKKRGIEIKINLSKRWLYTLIVIGILAIIGVGVYAVAVDKDEAWHDESQVEVIIGSTTKSLQDAIDDGDFASEGIDLISSPVVLGQPCDQSEWGKIRRCNAFIGYDDDYRTICACARNTQESENWEYYRLVDFSGY